MRGKPHRKGHHTRPRTVRPKTDEAQPAAENGAATATATRRKCVLVVEDNATIGGLLVALLREEGYRALQLSQDDRALVNDTVAKPFDIDRLMNVFRRHLGDEEVDVPERAYDKTDSHLNSW